MLFRSRLALAGWAVTALLSVGVIAGLGAAGLVRDYVPVALALTTTALGTLLPILHDNNMLTGDFGRYVLAAGAVGELCPILAIAVFLTERDHFAALLSVAAVGLVAIVLISLPYIPRPRGAPARRSAPPGGGRPDRGLARIIREGQDTTGQTTLRWAVVLLFLLLVVASRFGLDVVLGAVLAGIVLRGWTRRANIDTEGLEQKFDALGYGFFIPVFFIWSGMTLDIAGIADNPLRVLIFFLLLLFTRGLPSMIIYRRSLPVRQRVQMTFITATGMPLLIALAEIGLRDGKMLPANAAALVGAGVLSVLVFPAAAVRLSGRPPGPRPGRPAPAELPSDSK